MDANRVEKLAFAIRVNDRFFVRFGTKGRLVTTRYLAGARLFIPAESHYWPTYSKLNNRGLEPSLFPVVERP